MKTITEVNGTGDKLVVVSIGTHTRLGDVLETALSGIAFETVTMEALLRGRWEDRRLLFAISAGEDGENAQLRVLASQFTRGACVLNGCACACIVDGATGGQAHLDTIKLLLAANEAGAEVIAAPLLESGRELRAFASGKEAPFARYCALAQGLVRRLMEANPLASQTDAITSRFVTTLEAGTTRDWRALIARFTLLCDKSSAKPETQTETILLCENQNSLPDEVTLSRLTGCGYLRILLASPTTGSELYLASLLERAVLRGSYALPSRAVLVFEGYSAFEVLSSKAEVERLKAFF